MPLNHILIYRYNTSSCTHLFCYGGRVQCRIANTDHSPQHPGGERYWVGEVVVARDKMYHMAWLDSAGVS